MSKTGFLFFSTM